MRDADQVLVVSVGKDRHALLASGDLGTHLARHGVEVETRIVAAAMERDADEIVQSITKDTNSELLVMGGYGHTRLREIVLGGVTRHVLSEMTVPVLMSH